MTSVDLFETWRLDGRIAVVTGAGSGIGRACAILLAEAGARVVATDVDNATLRQTVESLGEEGEGLVLDLTQSDAARTLATAASATGSLDIWVNAAGVGFQTPITQITPQQYVQVRSINQDAVYWCCAEAARHMATAGRGSIINVSSNAADQPMAGLSAYAMTKAAVNMLTRSLAAELGPSGIRVNAVAPGFIVTPMTAPAGLDDDTREALLSRNAARSPLGRVGEGDDVARAILYLASDASRFVTGQILRVNGGAYMP